MNDLSPLAQALNKLNQQEALSLVKQQIDAGTPAIDIVNQCHQGMAEIGRRFDQGECFIPELVVSGKIMETIMKDLEPLLGDANDEANSSGCVVLGTVQHDVHDIGKDIVSMMLKGSGYKVVDLGVDAPPQAFVDAIKANNPIVVGMSVLLTTCYKSIITTIEAIQAAGLRDNVSIMVGGAAATTLLAEKTGCDFYGETAVDGLNHVNTIAQPSA